MFSSPSVSRAARLGVIVPILFILSSPAAEGSPGPNLTGTWILNKGDSDDPRDALQDRDGGRGRGGGGKGGRGGRRGAPPADGAGNTRAERQDSGPQFDEAISRLEIFQEGIELNITDGLDMTRLLFTDGQESTVYTQEGPTIATVSVTGATLSVRWTIPGNDREMKQHFTLAADGKRLTVRIERAARDDESPAAPTLVYDLATPPASSDKD